MYIPCSVSLTCAGLLKANTLSKATEISAVGAKVMTIRTALYWPSKTIKNIIFKSNNYLTFIQKINENNF